MHKTLTIITLREADLRLLVLVNKAASNSDLDALLNKKACVKIYLESFSLSVKLISLLMMFS
ncbi:BnaA08g14440D [Brassica napus]|uniref:BnaA08g14440D protein n=1 Tax=Brassica napus TaxID=3708 RepID=A0A078FPQ0_BRANA|nr:BnaA08g14440D [Brassica napus]